MPYIVRRPDCRKGPFYRVCLTELEERLLDSLDVAEANALKGKLKAQHRSETDAQTVVDDVTSEVLQRLAARDERMSMHHAPTTTRETRREPDPRRPVTDPPVEPFMIEIGDGQS